MDKRDEEFRKKLLLTFKTEAEEHLNAMTSGLVEIEKGDPQKQSEVVETVFRESHSLKGAARSVNHTDIVAICQAMESVLSAFKRRELVPATITLDLLHKAVGFIGRLVGGQEFSTSEKSATRELIRVLEGEAGKRSRGETVKRADGRAAKRRNGANGEPVSAPCAQTQERASVPGPLPGQTPTIRISAAKLDALLLQAEEMLLIKLATAQRVLELKQLKKSLDLWKRQWKKKPSRMKRPEQKTRAGDKDGIDLSFSSLESDLTRILKAAESDQRSFGIMVDSLLADTKKTLMLPFSSLLEVFPGLVRNLSHGAGKEADLVTEGEFLEMDRRILEEIKDPLIHIVRNCIDHGIEMPEERLGKRKPRRGEVRIAVSSRNGMIEIAVSDDGAGIDGAALKTAAEKGGFLSPEEAARLSDEELQLLAFRSGVSTSPIVTDLSGRGIGLAIVREKAEKLSGTIDITSKPDAGTTLRMILPLTLATYRGVIVRVREHLFAIPSINVQRAMRVKKEEIRTIENRESFALDGRAVSLVRLGAVLQMKSEDVRAETDSAFEQLVVLASGESQMAFIVDEILHEQEVLVKPFSKQLSRVRNFSGATILGSGKVVPILNVSDLMKSAMKLSTISLGPSTDVPVKRVSVLVAEDSITARTLLRTILESAGYDVKVAVDGEDALALLKREEFDILVSDVDMPRMNGFDLTAKVRSDKKLSELPVILVTGLESAEDKRRGIDVGANAYIVKSSFDQTSLLDTIKRLI